MKVVADKTIRRSLCYAFMLTGIALIVLTHMDKATHQPQSAHPEQEANPVAKSSTRPAPQAIVVSDQPMAQAIDVTEAPIEPNAEAEQKDDTIDAELDPEALATQFEDQDQDLGWASATEAAVTMTLMEFAPDGITVHCKSSLCQASTAYADEAAVGRLVQHGLNQLDGFIGGHLQANPNSDNGVDVTVFLIRREA